MDFMQAIPGRLREKALAAESATALVGLAQAEGVSLTEAQAQTLFFRLHPTEGELSDQELEAVSGGGCRMSSNCGTGDEHTYNPYRLAVGDSVRLLKETDLCPCYGVSCHGNHFYLTSIDRNWATGEWGYRCIIKCPECLREQEIYLLQLCSV